MDSEFTADLVTSYDANADDREAAGEPEWRSPIRADFASRLAQGARLLEIGAGVGYTARFFADQGFDVTATDLSPQNVERCRAKGVKAEVRDIASLGFSTGAFDAIWAASCLMHIADHDLSGALSGIREVLVPGGLFWAGTWGGSDQEGPWEEDWYRPKRFYSHRTDERMRDFYEAHFTIVAFETFRPEESIEWSYQSCLMIPR